MGKIQVRKESINNKTRFKENPAIDPGVEVRRQSMPCPVP
jgi:hypothetical protein